MLGLGRSSAAARIARAAHADRSTIRLRFIAGTPCADRLRIPREIHAPFRRHELRRAAMLRGELPEPKLARVVHLAECVLRIIAGEETRRFRECDPAALPCRQTLQRGPERALARSREP